MIVLHLFNNLIVNGNFSLYTNNTKMSTTKNIQKCIKGDFNFYIIICKNSSNMRNCKHAIKEIQFIYRCY